MIVSGSGYGSALGVAVGSVLVCAVAALWVTSARAVVRVLAVQGIVLGGVAAVLGVHARDGLLVATAVGVVAVKGILAPLLLARVARDDPARTASSVVNGPSSLIAAAVLTIVAYAAARPVAALVPGSAGALVPAGIATVLIGFLALVARRRATFQIAGILLVDNGVALTAFLVTSGVPLLVEAGASFDVLLAVVVLQVLASHMRAAFGDLDLDQLRELHD